MKAELTMVPAGQGGHHHVGGIQGMDEIGGKCIPLARLVDLVRLFGEQMEVCTLHRRPDLLLGLVNQISLMSLFDSDRSAHFYCKKNSDMEGQKQEKEGLTVRQQLEDFCLGPSMSDFICNIIRISNAGLALRITLRDGNGPN